ncbi:uncharacterized protein LOC114581182 isoform X3 [Dendrobium catenatum]|uniref:uncharacterized protein LOC114581182 isoform X3 n=1 Tax=Dendrobium catenatum TaxID=906689 RepID=UPI0010A0595C|nr:uncharacterized protein LOC114581182 isoform X3 [Dendrobium catenatum]
MWQCLRTETSARGAFFELGREYCTNPLEATRDALTVFVSISKEVDDLFFRKDGAVKGLHKNTVIVILSTLSINYLHKLEKRFVGMPTFFQVYKILYGNFCLFLHECILNHSNVD